MIIFVGQYIIDAFHKLFNTLYPVKNEVDIIFLIL